MTAPTPKSAGPVQKATVSPWTAACAATAVPVAWLQMTLAAAVIASVLRRAVPTEPPTCWLVLTSADATPASAGSCRRWPC
jgi:hypothetical protein